MGPFILAALGIICALTADSRGRSAVASFFLGFLFHLFAIVLILVLPDLKVMRAREQQLRNENRRLKERVNKDRRIADERHGSSMARLQAHDHALGMNSHLSDSTDAAGVAPPPLPAGAASVARVEGFEWFYVRDGNPEGPFRFHEMREFWQCRDIKPATLVWCTGMPTWVPVKDHADLWDAFCG